MSFGRTITFLALTGSLLAAPQSAFAQAGALVNGAVGVVTANDSTDLEVSAGVGYRFNRALSFGLEFTHIPSFESRQPVFYPLAAAARICCGLGDDDFDGHATVFTTNVRLEVPTTVRRVIPFVIGGGGLASLTEEFPIYYALPLADLAGLGLPTSIPNILPGPQNYSTTTLAMALTLGGGGTFLLTDHLGIDADLRVLKLLAQDNRTIGRFQVGASYRF